MSLQRHQRAVRNLGGFTGGTSHLARPPAELPEPDVRPGLDLPHNVFSWIADEDAVSMSAFYSDIDQDLAEGDFLFTMLFVYGAGGSGTAFTEDGGVTQELSTLAPSPPRRAFAYKLIAPDPLTSFALQWTWPSDVSAAAINVGINQSGLDEWTLDWWSDGPAASATIPGYDIHLGFIVFTWSDAGTAVSDADLIVRSDVLADIGVVEAWWLPGDSSEVSTVDLEVTALSGNVQWFAWVDLYEP